MLSECCSFWKGYRFHDTEKEQQFQNLYLPDLLRFCQVWCVINVAFDTVQPFTMTASGFSPAFYLAHVPGIATALGLLIIVSCFPSNRRHILFWVSAATILTAASRGMLVHFQSEALLGHSLQDELGEVAKEVSDNKVAMDQLESFLGRRTIISVMNAQLAQGVLNFLLLACAGFAQSMLWSCVLQPVMFLAALLMSPHVRMHMSVVPVRRAGMFIAYVLLIVRMRSDCLEFEVALVFLKAFVPRRRQTACPKDLLVRGECCAFLWPQAQSCQAWGPVLAPCERVGIGDSAHPAAPQRITTVGLPPAVGLRLVLMPISLCCYSAASFFGLCPPAFLFCCRFLG